MESEKVYKTIRETDGLVDDESNRGGVIIDDGYLWFGSAFGVTKYNLDYVDKTSLPPNTFITSIQIYDQPVAVDSFTSVSALEYNQNYLQFEFAAVELESPEKVTYRYRLNGLEENWNFSKRSFVQYTNLDPGEYTFEVSAADESKQWSKPARISFKIDPPFWLTWWFITGAALLLIGIIIYLVTYRLRQLLALERIRSKISADLHDSIGSGLSEISIMSEMMKLKSPNENEEMKKGLEEISEISRDLIKDMSDIVWLVNPKKESFEDLLLRLNDHYQELFSHKEINFEIDNLKLAADVNFPIDTRRNLFLIIKEAVNNSVKYSGCKNIVIKIEKEGKLISIKIIDDGKGFDMDKVKKGNGIVNIKHRAKVIGGKAEIMSETEKRSNSVDKT
ncbi:MAG: triple tyrosine motif-containing protein [Melioribacteraceae bacterium]|nr:triple tyrosine motif-containing protein [Melioribacteraceae bacterium]